ncbi:MAG: ABC transporter ATP-binding protein [Lachnospiraceae bacterium]
MRHWLIKKYGLTSQGAANTVNGILLSAVTNLVFMMPVAGLMIFLLDAVIAYFSSSDLQVSNGIYAALILMTLIFMFLLGILQFDAVFTKVYDESTNRRLNLAERLRKLPLAFFGQRDLSDLTKVIMSDCAEIEHVFSHAICQFYGSIISTVLSGILLLLVDWRLALALIWVIPISFCIILLSGKITTTLEKNVAAEKLEVTKRIQEGIENIRELKAYHMESRYRTDIEKQLAAAEKACTRKEIINGMMVTGGDVVLRFGLGTVMLIGGWLFTNGNVDFILYFVFLVLASRFYDPLSAALSRLSEILHSEVHSNRLKEIDEQNIQEGSSDIDIKEYDIHFDNVSFGYNSTEKVLDGISFEAKQGEVTALIGPSGGGKSTAAKLAARFWDIDEGVITVGGVDIDTVDPEHLLKYYAIVFQDVVLFNDTIINNIRLGRKNATDQEVIAAAKAAICEEFIQKLPHGYQTIIGENGAALSGGERQRLSIARALLKDAPIILLDEATSSLDVENETKIQKALSTLIKGKTVLIIAHRLRTVAGADNIVVLQDGKVAEQGTHDQLMLKNGVYTHMMQIQQQCRKWTL